MTLIGVRPSGFQFALPRGERRWPPWPNCRHRSVSIRAPAWGATMSEMSSAYSWPFQFALPRGERHSYRQRS